VPDVLAQSGAVLREVGTTNKTRLNDYGAAIGDRTALILRVHPSNFRIEGFTERPALDDLVKLGARLNVPVVEDLGSGHLGTIADHPLATAEPSVRASVAAGVSICCFSGDKLLGGPQAGIVVGRKALVDVIRRHPLMRAVRVDKLTYAALEATLAEYAAGRGSSTIPVQQMLTMSTAAMRIRADALAAAINRAAGWKADVVKGMSAVGGGSAPGVELPTWLVSVVKDSLSAAALEEKLRTGSVPVIARIDQDRVVLDLRTVLQTDDTLLAELIQQM
jgi:L-seryl-tRNA(Ser) seleniumtransferase